MNRAGALEDYTRGRIQSGNRYRFDGSTASFAGRARARALGRAKWRIAPVQLRGVWGGKSWPVRTGGERQKGRGRPPGPPEMVAKGRGPKGPRHKERRCYESLNRSVYFSDDRFLPVAYIYTVCIGLL